MGVISKGGIRGGGGERKGPVVLASTVTMKVWTFYEPYILLILKCISKGRKTIFLQYSKQTIQTTLYNCAITKYFIRKFYNNFNILEKINKKHSNKNAHNSYLSPDISLPLIKLPASLLSVSPYQSYVRTYPVHSAYSCCREGGNWSASLLRVSREDKIEYLGTKPAG